MKTPTIVGAFECGMRFEQALYFNWKRLQFNPEIFNTFLVQQPKAPERWSQLGISVGNPDAGNVILKVCMLYCAPCSRAHTIIEEIISSNDNVQLWVIFKCKNADDDKGVRVAKHLLEVAAQGDKQRRMDH